MEDRKVAIRGLSVRGSSCFMFGTCTHHVALRKLKLLLPRVGILETATCPFQIVRDPVFCLTRIWLHSLSDVLAFGFAAIVRVAAVVDVRVSTLVRAYQMTKHRPPFVSGAELSTL